MTRKQVEKLAEWLGQLGVAALVGSVGDLAIVGTRFLVDMIGIALGLLLLRYALDLTGLLRGPKIKS